MIKSELIVRASAELSKQVDDELKVSDPTKEKALAILSGKYNEDSEDDKDDQDSEEV
jgi:hypothetical protein